MGRGVPKVRRNTHSSFISVHGARRCFTRTARSIVRVETVALRAPKRVAIDLSMEEASSLRPR